MRKFSLILLFSIIPTIVSAQTNTLHWDYLATTPAVVATYQQTVVVNGTTVTATPTCVARGADTTCNVPVTLNATGNNIISVTATLNNISTETVATVNLTTGPVRPTGPRIKIVITIGE